MKTFNSVNEFKKILEKGDKLLCTSHMAVAGRDENLQPIFKDEIKPVRQVSIKQSNRFALATNVNGTITNSWVEIPPAKFCKVVDNKLIIMVRDYRLFKGGLMDEKNPDYAKLPLIPRTTIEFSE